MAHMGWATLRLLWYQLTATPSWLCDGLVLGAAVAAMSSTCALAFASALVRLPEASAAAALMPNGGTGARYAACPECSALRLFNHIGRGRRPAGYTSTLLEFSADSLVVEAAMSCTISVIIVTFALFLVREMR